MRKYKRLPILMISGALSWRWAPSRLASLLKVPAEAQAVAEREPQAVAQQAVLPAPRVRTGLRLDQLWEPDQILALAPERALGVLTAALLPHR
jgi:hypothetical protein